MKSPLKGKCRLHQGELDLRTMLPIDANGRFINRGYRLCGINECLNPDHITTRKDRARRWLGEIPNLVRGNQDIKPAELYAIAKPQVARSAKGCLVKTCAGKHSSAGLCVKHANALYRYIRANNLPPIGKVPPINYEAIMRPPVAPGDSIKMSENYCHIEGCSNPHNARNLCKAHYSRYIAKRDKYHLKYGKKKSNNNQKRLD